MGGKSPKLFLCMILVSVEENVLGNVIHFAYKPTCTITGACKNSRQHCE